MIRTISGAAVPPLPIKTAARYLNVSHTPIRKGLAAGVIPDLSLTTIDALSRRDVLEYAETATGAPVAVLRLAPLYVVAGDDADAPPRTYAGYEHGMSDADLLSSTDRWWPTSGRDTVVAAESMLIACGSIAVAWADINVEGENHGIRIDSRGLLQYRAHIVARLDDVLTRSIRTLDPSSPNLELAQQLVGLRVLGGEGGSITGLKPAES